jgi:ADP-ribose pyrophosphatase
VIDPYHVIESSTWVNIIALTASGQIVLVREYRHGIQKVMLGLPGGGVETKDGNPLEAMQRELREETGYGGGTFFKLGWSYPNASNQNNIVWSFLALDVTQSHQQDLDENENIEVVLQDFVDFSEQAWKGEVDMQSMHLTTLGWTTQFILRSRLPQLHALRSRLLQGLSND